jgi:hypothetical protein
MRLNQILQKFVNPLKTKRRNQRPIGFRPHLELLESRLAPTVSVITNFAGITGGGPPDTCGAAGPNSYIETINTSVEIFNKTTGAQIALDGLNDFFFTVGGLSLTDGGSRLADATMIYDEPIGRFIVADMDINFGTHVGALDFAVSKNSNPTALDGANWSFYKIGAENGYDTDYPGNMGYNADAFVWTFQQFNPPGGNLTGHTLVTAMSQANLAANGNIGGIQFDMPGFSYRPTTMHDSAPGGPMWLVQEGGGNNSINLVRVDNILDVNNVSTTTFNRGVNSYGNVNPALNPDGSQITPTPGPGVNGANDTRVLKAAEANNLLVACQNVGIGSTEDVARWYVFNVSDINNPTVANQGDYGFGNNTYTVYPSIDINPAGDIGLAFSKSGTDNANDFTHGDVVGMNASDGGAMEGTAIIIGGGNSNINGREGDFSGISVDPVNGTFWAAQETSQGGTTTAIGNWTMSNGGEAFVKNGVLVVTGTNADDNITLQPFTLFGLTFTQVVDNGVVLGDFFNGSFSSIGFGGNDSLAITDNGGNQGLDFYSGVAISFDGGTGANSVFLDDSTASFSDTYTITSSSVSRVVFGGLTYSNTQNVTLDMENGNDTVNIESTSAAVTVNMGSGTDTVNIAPSSQFLDNIQGDVFVNGGSGTDTMNVNDQTDGFGDTWTITGSTITRTAAATIHYGFINFVNIFGGTGNETYNVNGTEPTFATTLNTGDGDDTVNVEGTSGKLTVNLGGGFDFVNITPTSQFLDNIQGDVFVNGGSSTDTLNVDDQTDGFNDTWTITGSTITRTAAATIHYGFIDFVNIFGGSGAETYNVNSTEANFLITLNTGDGNDTVNVEGTSSNGPLTVNLGNGTDTVNITPTSQLLDNIPGQVTINGGIASSDTLVLNDQANTLFASWSITGSNVTRTSTLFFGRFLFFFTGSVNYSHIGNLIVNGGSGGNEFDLSPTAMNLGELPANVTVNGAGSSNTAILDDQNDANSSTWNVGGSSVARSYTRFFFFDGFLFPLTFTTTIHYSNLSSLVLNGGSGGSEFDLSPSTENLDELPATVTINGGGSANSLNVFDQGNSKASTWNVGSTSLNRTWLDVINILGIVFNLPITRTINYSSLTSLAVHGGGGGNTFNITGTPASTGVDSGAGNDQVNVQASANPLSINGDSGADTVILGSNAPSLSGTLSNIAGPVSVSNHSTVDGTLFTGQTNLVADDSGDGSSRTAVLTSSSLSGLGPVINYTAGDVTNLTVNGGSGPNNIYNVQSTAGGTSVILNAGSGNNDNVNVGSGGVTSTLDAVQGALTVNSQTSLTALHILDGGSASGHTYTLTANTLSRSGAALITYDPVTQLTIAAGSGDDTLTVVSTALGTPVTFAGGGGMNTLIGPNSPSTFDITSNNGGTVGNVTFSSVQNLVGGSANDTFRFHNGKGVSGTIDGGAGTNTLDYSLYTTGINVNLPAGTATGTSGVSNIQNVTGTPANDTIVGNPGSVIRGNGGQDTLSGGANDTFIMAATQTAGTTVTAAGSGNSLVAANLTNTWVLTGPGSGTLDGIITYSGIANLTGGSGTDTFKFNAGGSVTGTINGGGGSNALDYSAFGSAITVNLQTHAATGTGGFANIGTLTGSGAAADALVGANIINTWTITAPNTGTVGAFAFSAIANLTGGTGNDTFRFVGAGANITGNLAGGGETDTLDYSGNGGGAVAVNLQTQVATSIGGTFSSILVLVGSTNVGNALTAANGPWGGTNAWSITGANAGKVNNFTFSAIEHLIGGACVDTFTMSAAGSVTSIDGGGAPVGKGDWLDYSALAISVIVNLATGSATNVNGGAAGAVANIQNVISGSGAATLTGNSQGNILIGHGGNDTINGGTGVSLLIGGTGASTINGGSGGDIMIGGRTTYDTANHAALMAILAEWQSADSYTVRTQEIRTGTIPGQPGIKLAAGTTVILNSAATPEHLNGAASTTALDWFFAAAAAQHSALETVGGVTESVN